MYRYFKSVAVVGSSNYIYFWISKGLSDEDIRLSVTSDYSLTSKLSCCGTKDRVEFKGSCLKQDKITYNHRTIVGIYIVYEINKNFNITSYPALKNCLFGAVSLTKNVNTDKYKHSGYGIGFHRMGTFLVGNGFGRNCIIFELDMSSSLHVDNKKKYILILGEGPTKGLYGKTLTAAKRNSVNFTKNNKKFCLGF